MQNVMTRPTLSGADKRSSIDAMRAYAKSMRLAPTCTADSTARDNRRTGSATLYQVATSEGTMTLAQAKAACQHEGYTLRHQDGEYALTPHSGGPTYYTNDLQDAVDTAVYATLRPLPPGL